jgi:hypothetical protein
MPVIKHCVCFVWWAPRESWSVWSALSGWAVSWLPGSWWSATGQHAAGLPAAVEHAFIDPPSSDTVNSSSSTFVEQQMCMWLTWCLYVQACIHATVTPHVARDLSLATPLHTARDPFPANNIDVTTHIYADSACSCMEILPWLFALLGLG